MLRATLVTLARSSKHQLPNTKAVVKSVADTTREPTRLECIRLYKQLYRMSRTFRVSDPEFFMARMRQEFRKERTTPDKIKYFERGQTVLAHRDCIL
ncbi:hypothetical protein QOT17_012691 [Balamuthia mandrillaris]